MPIPRDVQKAIDKGEAAFAALQAGGAPDTMNRPDAKQAAADALAKADKRGGLIDEGQPKLSDRNGPQPSREDATPQGNGSRPPAEPDPEPQDPQPDANTEIERVQQQYRTLQGKYNSETSRAREEAATLRSQMADMSVRMQELQKQLDQKPLATPKEREDFGDDMVDMVERLATERAQQMTGQLNARIAELESRLQATGQDIGRLRTNDLATYMDHQLPDWRQQNQNIEFVQWLQNSDALSGHPRKALLDDAVSSGDTGRVLAIFQAFRRETGYGKTEGPKPRLDTLAQPPAQGRAAPHTAPTEPPPEQRYSRAQIDQFNRDLASGALRRKGYTQADITETLAEIDKALREGRIDA